MDPTSRTARESGSHKTQDITDLYASAPASIHAALVARSSAPSGAPWGMLMPLPPTEACVPMSTSRGAPVRDYQSGRMGTIARA
jgi:hypothetical protein